MRRLGYSFLLIGVILLLISVSVYMYNDMEAKHASEVAEANLGELKEQMKAVIESNSALETTESTRPVITENDLEEMAGIKPKQEREMKLYKINGYDYIGYIVIPSANVELPILKDIEPIELLKISPCLYSGSPYDDNMIIAGHYYRDFFQCLYDVKEGDELIFIDWDGRSHKYKAAIVDIIGPNGAEELKNSPYPLTLFTCTEDSEARYVVRYEHAE